MKFYIYHRPLYSVRKNVFLGTLLHISQERKDFRPDDSVWQRRTCIRSEKVYNRLNKMLNDFGVDQDNVCTLTDGREVHDLMKFMTTWEKDI